MKKIHTAIAVVGIALAGGAAWWWQNKPSTATSSNATDPSAGKSMGAGPSVGAAPGGGAGGPSGAGGQGPILGNGPGEPESVEVARAEIMTLTDDVQAVGSLKSRQGVTLKPETSGRVAKLAFTDGQRVKRGQLLVQLDDTLQQAQLQQAQAQFSIARSNLERSRELQAQNFVSQSAVDQNLANLQVADAQVALAQAQVARLKVLAPFDGSLGIRAVQVGDYVKDGADLVGIEDLSALFVEFTLPERYVSRVRTGLPVELALDAIPGKTYKGRIDALDVSVDPNGRALRVRAAVDNPGSVLKPGMFARPRVVFSVREGAVVVPEEALVPQGSRQLIFKVVAGAAEGQFVSQRLEAKIGLRLPGKVEILEGVSAGDAVVTAGHARLLRGEAVPVRVIDLSKPPGGPGGPGGAGAGAGKTAAPAAPGAAPGAGSSAGSSAGPGAKPGSAAAPQPGAPRP